MQELASRGENLRPLMKNIAGIMATATEDNFEDEGRPDKWVDLSETTKKQRQKIGKYPGQILQVSGQLASSVSTAYDDNSAVVSSNLAYAMLKKIFNHFSPEITLRYIGIEQAQIEDSYNNFIL